MSEERATLEIIAPSVEEALNKGLTELGLSETDVEIEILDEGSKGVLGIGSRQARLRLTVRDGETHSPVSSSDMPPSTPISSGPLDPEIENTVAIATATVTELLEKMHVTANVNARVTEEEEPGSLPNIIVDITGKDLSILIGPKAETLNALQFITRLIVGKEIGRSSNIQVDVEGYRDRRERSLRQMAEKMAGQAIRSGRKQTLEPMTAAERRIIHIALRNNHEVETESVGDDPRRKVTIIPVM